MGAARNTPKSSPKKKSTTLEYLFNVDSKSNSNNVINKKITEKSCLESNKEQLLSYISYCAFVMTFKDPLKYKSQQDLKRPTLTQLLYLVKSSKKPFEEEVVSSLMFMISVNLFRPLPPPSTNPVLSDLADDEDTVTAAPAWPHLQIVYDILQELIINYDPKILQNYMDQTFLLNLLSLFQSEDPRERESLRNVYHRIYAKFTCFRSFMRKSMNDVFLHYVFETERHDGIAELLEIWGSIINGFTVPIKEEHKLFLMRVLVPLHKPKGMLVYHKQLAYCITQFVRKEPMLGGVVIRGILKYWPFTNWQKEVLLIGELEELVENVDTDQYRRLALPLCTQIAKSMNSWNSQVAERALYLWNNDHFVKMVSRAMKHLLPVLVESVDKNLKWHWSKSVRELTASVKMMLQDMEPDLYSKFLKELDVRESLVREEEMKRKQKWERIEIAAAKNQFLRRSPCICVSH